MYIFFALWVMYESQRCCLVFRFDTQLLLVLIYPLRLFVSIFLGRGSNTEPLGRSYGCIILQGQLCF